MNDMLVWYDNFVLVKDKEILSLGYFVFFIVLKLCFN